MKYDVIIIGAGITGNSIAFELSKYKLKVAVIDKENDVANATTKANSGIIHGGYDPIKNTYMAKCNVIGNRKTRELAKKLNVHIKNIGSLVVGRKEKDKEKIDELYERGITNGVPGLSIIDGKEQVHLLEKNLQDDIDYALLCTSACIISPWEYALALAYTAKVNGTDFFLDEEVTDIDKTESGFIIKTSKNEYQSDFIFNCTGLYADKIFDLALKDAKEESFKITPVKGEYYLLDKDQGDIVSHVIFQIPSEKGKGVLVSPTVHGNLIIGPDALEIEDKDDVSNTYSGLSFVKESSKQSVKNINFASNIRNFTGIRATIKGYDDFYIKESKTLPRFINFAGIKSPGLSSAIEFGTIAVSFIRGRKRLDKKKHFTLYPLPTFFKDLKESEKIKLLKKDPDYGEVICRCETVTLGEIKKAIDAPIGARSIDGIKRRTNAGMGRCQGGFCSPKVFSILKKKLNLPFDEVYQDKTGSKIVLFKTKGGK